METIDGRHYMSALPPWRCSRPAKSQPDRPDRRESQLRYRGWTLVDVGTKRYACKDNTVVRMRVCRSLGTSQKDAIRMFRRAVDREEDGR